MNIQEIKGQLKTAIDSHFEIEIIYKDDINFRTAHPYHFGMNGDTEQLHLYQTDGPSESGANKGWKNYELSEIKKLNLTNRKFTPPDKGYNPSSMQYKTIECQIEYDGMGNRRKPR